MVVIRVGYRFYHLLVFFMKVTPTGMVPNEDTGTIMGAVTLLLVLHRNVQWKS